MDMTLEFEYLKNETQNAILGYPHGALFAGEKHVVVAQTRVGAVGNTEIFAAGSVVSLPQPNKETHHEPSHRIQSHPRIEARATRGALVRRAAHAARVGVRIHDLAAPALRAESHLGVV